MPQRWPRVALSIGIVLVLGISPGKALAQAPSGTPDSARARLSRELLTLMNVGDGMLYGMKQGLEAQRAANPNIPEVFWSTFLTRAQDSMGTFIDRIVPVYATRFSAAELNELIAFYRTPVGRRTANESAAIAAELMRAGQLWGVELGADVAKELAAQGILLQ